MNTLEKLAQVNKAARYVARQRLVKKADLDTEIEKAKRLRDSSFTDDLLYNTLIGGLTGAGIGGWTGIGLGTVGGLIEGTRPSETTGITPYAAMPIGVGPLKLDINGKEVEVPRPQSQAEAYDLSAAAGSARNVPHYAKKGLLYGGAGGAGIGAFLSLLTYGYRKEQAKKKLKELGIE